MFLEGNTCFHFNPSRCSPSPTEVAEWDPKGLGEGHTQLQMPPALAAASARSEQASRLAYPPALLNIAGRSILTPPTKNQCRPPQHEAGGAVP
eukprot:1141195-Pelagomonas_calceolata.AAC.5